MFCDEFGGHATFIGKFCFVFGLWILQLTAITAADKSCAFTVEGGACFHSSVTVACVLHGKVASVEPVCAKCRKKHVPSSDEGPHIRPLQTYRFICDVAQTCQGLVLHDGGYYD